ncbi:NAD-dependent epimerase/dehydratase family protein [Desulfosporosinus nitroreducens]|uniref:NAD-dependent epimerase/dehydratase family protein n=1 Tax=Desulfosporosinus nitroreducens TaxID=2018668 RepID=A0ABT8QUT6_9FIRM|nr:NAD-dependent epimerase/dehydratase family protein [Desulfosporosinus nitroreducens]MCO1604157.1 NAD-dependent epimerase/dehydratase family protein [Desulfosporosinus nitroreducens]MDO0825116.1 NAD-dependent epimerase/dehydratase family protein [Desulfosporosinus nitroreducens]
MLGKSALLVGASGLVGGELLTYLLNGKEYSKVLIFVRKTLGIKHPKLEERLIKFEDLAGYKDYFEVNDVFCCLGTTIKKARSQEAFKKVDLEYPLEIARLAKEMKAEKFLVISSMGANPKSSVFYSRIKGLLEQELKDISIKSLHIFRPSLLLGARREFRFSESASAFITKGISFIFVGSLKKYKPINAKTVAAGMYKAAQSETVGIHTYLSNEIAELS